jgi:antitoxin MazE
MTTEAQKWGNSLAIRIPAAFVRQIGIGPGSRLELRMKSGKLVITPRRRRYQLRALLARARPSNLHAETSWGASRGAEAW